MPASIARAAMRVDQSAGAAKAALRQLDALVFCADPRSDLFSLGVLLYELVGGASPFAAEGAAVTMQRVLHDLAPSLAEAHPDVQPALASLIDHLLAKDPAHRPQSTHKVAVRLHALLPGR